ncbi:MAG: prenyltransferase [Paludibacteraceae bacterium]|nr:prenyltransferase [Paludibacteraceae bacterium]
MNPEEGFEKYYHGHHKGVFFWIRNSRAIALPQSALPALLAIVLCIGQDGFTWWVAILAFFGVCIGHLGMNLADDYFDYKRDSRIRSTLSSKSIRARMDKCTYINNGDATIQDLGKAVCVFLGIAGGIGLICVFAQWWLHGEMAALWVILYALAGLFVGINYSGAPLKLCMHGLGELVIGLMFGPLLMLGMQAAVCGIAFSWPMAVISAAIGLLVTNIVYVHSVMETDADGELGKMTFARLFKSRTTQLVFVGIFALVPFALLGLGIALGWWSWWYLTTLLTLPMSIYLIYSLTRFVKGLPTNDNPRWWMGPMTEFEIFKETGMDWFLIRWLLARNVVMYWCLIIIIVQVILLCCN